MSFIVLNPQRISILLCRSPPLLQNILGSLSSLFCFVFLTESSCTYLSVFSKRALFDTLYTTCQTTDRRKYRLSGKHIGIFSNHRARCFPLEFVETKTELKADYD